MTQNIDNVGNLYYIVTHNQLQGGYASKLPKLILLLVNGVCMILVLISTQNFKTTSK
jgi:hypothetical protein